MTALYGPDFWGFLSMFCGMIYLRPHGLASAAGTPIIMVRSAARVVKVKHRCCSVR